MSIKLSQPVFACLLCALILLGAATEARSQEKDAPPEVPAGSWALADLRSGEYLAGEEASQRRPVASTTKILAALVAIERAEPDEEAVVSAKAASYATPIYSNVGLYPGDRLSMRELLMAALISSGDDAAYALAEHAGDGSVERFVAMMNRKARSLGLEDTHFENPIGLDERGHYSSARDLAVITRAAFEHPVFREIVAKKTAAISTQDRRIPLTSTNELLSLYPPANGVKTGTTPGSGPSLVASASSGDVGFVAVVLDDANRFASSEKLLQYAFDHYDRRKLVIEGESYARADVPYRPERNIKLVAKENVEGLVEPGARVERRVEVVKDLPDSAGPETRLGTVFVKVDGERVGKSALVVRRGYEEASVLERVWYTVGGLFR